MFTELFGEDSELFSTLPKSLFTLFQMMTLDGWAEICLSVEGWAWLPGITYVIISGFVVVNLIIAVICDAVSELQKKDKARLHGTITRFNEHEFDETENDTDCPTSDEILEMQMKDLETHVEHLEIMQKQTLEMLEKLTKKLAASRDDNDGENE